MKIYLDDTRPVPNNSWTLTKTAQETIQYLISTNVEEISLDHDLGDDKENGTGYDVLFWIEEQVYTTINYIPPKIINIHTANVVARKKMEQSLKSIIAKCNNVSGGGGGFIKPAF